MRMTFNASYLQFHRTEVLQRLLFQSEVGKGIGFDGSLGVQYRPALNDNVLITGGVSFLLPARGFKQILTDQTLTTMFVVMTMTY
jgi:hypothetical protein